MTVQQEFLGFHNRIKLSPQDKVYSKAREKDDSITKAIKSAFNEEGYPVIDTFLQGSLATDTAILKKGDDFDIDRSIVIDFDTAPDNPVAPKKVVLDILEGRGFKNAKIKKPCVTADYTSENLHIDFPIYRRTDTDLYQLAVGKRSSDENNREWSASDPKGLKLWIKDNSAYGDSPASKQQQFNRVVRYLKRWRDEQFSESVGKKVYSIGLTVMAKHAFVPSMNDEGQLNDLEALKTTISNMLNNGHFISYGNDRYKVQVGMPVTPYRDIFFGSSMDTGTQLRNKLVNLRNKLIDAAAEVDLIKQCKILNTLFGEDFQVPDTEKSQTSEAKRTVYATAGAVGTSQGA